jgi:Tfp pilus assembly PilM family ATPase
MANAVGIDIGSQHIRAVVVAPPTRAQAREGARARLVAHACVARQTGDGSDKPLAAAIAEAMEQVRSRVPVVVHCSEMPALVRFVPTMPMPPERLERVLRLELAPHQDPDGDFAGDAVSVPGPEQVHCCVVVQPGQARLVLSALRSAGVGLEALHAAQAALVNCTLPSAPVRGDDLGLLVDIGANSTSVVLFGEDRFLACRQVAVGGESFTEALAAGGDRVQAEARKRAGGGLAPLLSPAPPPPPPSAKPELSLDDPPAAEPLSLELEDLPPEPLPAPASTSGTFELDLGGDLPAEIRPAGLETRTVAATTLGPELGRVAEHLYAQVASSLLWFRGQLRRERIEPVRVYLTGGGASLAGLDAYLQRRFGVPVAVFDPFACSDGSEAVAGTKPERPHEWASALGLALAGESLALHAAVRLDLRPEHEVRRLHARAHHRWQVAAGVLLVVASVCAAVVLWNRDRAAEASIAAIEGFKVRHKELSDKAKTLELEKLALADDLRAVAGRIYAGRDLLYAIRALKERAGRESEQVWVTGLETVGVGRDAASEGAAGVQRTARPQVHDTAIERGALLVAGRVKFEKSKTDTELNQYFKDYQAKLESWRPDPQAPPLFRSSLVEEFLVDHVEGARRGQPSGSFQFKLRFEFQPTQLDQLAATAAAGGRP